VGCACKGEAHKRYEFGAKASFATTQKKGFVFGAPTFPSNPYDGHTDAIKRELNNPGTIEPEIGLVSPRLD
jgi:hypothetical protein